MPAAEQPPFTYDEGREISFAGLKESPVINMDCFYLPFLGSASQVLFPVELMNKAMAHRICLVGVPTEKADFDSSIDQITHDFSNHDLFGHGHLFNYLEELILVFAQDNDPYLSAVHPLWWAIDTHQDAPEKALAHAGFFAGVHESEYPMLEPELCMMGIPPNRYEGLDKHLKTTLPQKKPEAFFPTVSWDAFEAAYLEALGRSPYYAHQAYEGEKRLHYGNYQLLQSLGVVLPDNLMDAGRPFTEETLPGVRLSEFYRDAVFPLLLKVQRPFGKAPATAPTPG